MAEEKKPAVKDNKDAKKTDDAVKSKAAKGGKSVKLDKMPILIGGIVAAVLVAVMVILAFVLGKPTEEKTDKKDEGGNSQVEDKDDKEDEDGKDVTLDKTLSVSKLSMKYPSKGWKLDDSEIDGADGTASISKGDDNYVLLTTVESDAGLTTKEFADSSMSSYKSSGFIVKESLSAVKIGGKEWYKARMYGQGAYATVLFNATGEDYYIATFASVSKDESEEVKKMIETLTIK